MSKSLARVRTALLAAGLEPTIVEAASDTRTAVQAAEAAGCSLDQIVKSILFRGEMSGRLYLFLTAGGHQVMPAIAAALAGEPLGRADAEEVRRVTGFAIGGVAPLGHLSPVPIWMDPRLDDFDTLWAAAGTPRHIFAVSPEVLKRITGAVVARFATPVV